MNNPLKISIISASPRKASNSLRVAQRIKQILEHKNLQEISICDFENYDIPAVGQGDLDQDQLTDFQQKLIDTWAAGELIIFVVPEYNWNTAPQLINAIDQLGGKPFEYLFNEKVFAFCGVSSGRGGRMPALQMTTLFNKIISFTNQYAIVSPKIYESHETAKNVDEHGNSLGNSFYDKPLEQFIDYSIIIAQKFLR
jgi:chromate reductase, NAD(P)H dehydrogenase (quinone)